MTGVSVHPDLDTLVQEVAELRPLPSVALRVLQIAESDHFSAHELAQTVSSDPALTAKILRLANSAYYGFPRRISTVRDAVVLLGFRAVRSATLAACVIDTMPRGRSIDDRTFWHFSVTVGMLAEVLSRATHRYADEALTAGVLHNIGRMALDQHRPDVFRRATTLARQEGLTAWQAEESLLGYTSAEVGEALALHWNFPRSLAEAVRSHLCAPGDLEMASLASYVARARAFAQGHGLTDGIDEPARTAPAHEWTIPPVAPVLEQGGGLDGLVRRAAVFIEHTSAAR
jgi:HD-like signal output (HDOD) protein